MYLRTLTLILFPGVRSVPGLGDAPRINTGSERLSTHWYVGLQRAHNVHHGSCYYLGKNHSVKLHVKSTDTKE